MEIKLKEIDKMVFVATLPRSGSSMDCGILDACGAFSGETIGEVRANPKGIFENRGLNQLLLQPIFKSIGINNHRGLKTLSDCGGAPMELFESFAEDLTYGLNRQSYVDGVAFFKNGLYTFFFNQINKVMPDAIWVLPVRNDQDIIKSNLKLKRNTKTKNILSEIADYRDMYETIKRVAVGRAFEIDNDKLMSGDFSEMKDLVSHLGLEWNQEKVDEWIEPDLWAKPPDENVEIKYAEQKPIGRRVNNRARNMRI